MTTCAAYPTRIFASTSAVGSPGAQADLCEAELARRLDKPAAERAWIVIAVSVASLAVSVAAFMASIFRYAPDGHARPCPWSTLSPPVLHALCRPLLEELLAKRYSMRSGARFPQSWPVRSAISSEESLKRAAATSGPRHRQRSVASRGAPHHGGKKRRGGSDRRRRQGFAGGPQAARLSRRPRAGSSTSGRATAAARSSRSSSALRDRGAPAPRPSGGRSGRRRCARVRRARPRTVPSPKPAGLPSSPCSA